MWEAGRNMICRNGGVDIGTSGLDSLSSVRITNAASSPSLNGYDIDGAIAIHNCEDTDSEGEVDGEGDGVDELLISAQTGVSEHAAYLNPAQGLDKVVFTTVATSRITEAVYDMNGRNVAILFSHEARAGQAYRLNFDGTALPNGVCIVRLTTGSEAIIEKFMIAR